MTDLTLAEAVIRLRSLGPIDSMNDPDLIEFVSVVGETGAKVLGSLSDEDKIGAVGLVLSVAMGDLMHSGEYKTLMFLMNHMEQLENIMAIALRTAVGLATIEEWR